MTASVPLLFGFGLVSASSAGQVPVRMTVRLGGADPWDVTPGLGSGEENSSSAPLRRPGPRGLATFYAAAPGHLFDCTVG